jgi:hypothetical protein
VHALPSYSPPLQGVFRHDLISFALHCIAVAGVEEAMLVAVHANWPCGGACEYWLQTQRHAQTRL